MKKLYVLFLSAVMVLGLGAATMAMDFSTYFGGAVSFTLENSDGDWSFGRDAFYAGENWGPMGANGLWVEFDGTAKLADNCTMNIMFANWWQPEWPGNEYAGMSLNASIKLTDVFNLLTVEFVNGNKKEKDVTTAYLGNLNWFHKSNPIIRISAPLGEGLNAQLSLATAGDELDYLVKANYSNDTFKVSAGYLADGDLSIEGAVTAIEGLKIEGGYGYRGGGTAYFGQVTFTGVENLTLVGKYKSSVNWYGPVKDYWDAYPTVFDGYDRYWEGGPGFGAWGYYDHFTYYGIAAEYTMDALTLSGNCYNSEELGMQWEIGAVYGIAENINLGGVYRLFPDMGNSYNYLVYSDFLFGGATLRLWLDVDGDYGMTMSAVVW